MRGGVSRLMTIRPAQGVEAGLLTRIAMASKATWGYSADFMSACAEELLVTKERIAHPRFHYAVAILDDDIVGFCALEHQDADCYELEALFVDPDYMGRGVGKRLTDYAVAYVRQNKGRRIVIQGDPNAEPFYLAIGATRVGDRPSASIPGRSLPLFELSVRP